MRRAVGVVAAGAAIAVVAAAVVSHRGGRAAAVETPEGVLLADASLYDRIAGGLLGGFYEGIARDVAASVRRAAGCWTWAVGRATLQSTWSATAWRWPGSTWIRP
jgi:hypothetical protein